MNRPGKYFIIVIFASFLPLIYSCNHRNGNSQDSAKVNSTQNKDSAKTKDTINANLAAKDVNTGVPIDGGMMIVTNNIVQNIASPKQFRTFLAALKQTGIDKVLEGRGPFTVFLPDNDAFSKLESTKWSDLMTQNKKSQLEKILKFHIIAGQVKVHDLVAGSSLTTIGGDQLVVIIENGKTKIMDGNGNLSEITRSDLLSKNGIIHVVNGVLMPKTSSE
jgi:uncharacterized surface protein with fasciclin (FAS1) repeats